MSVLVLDGLRDNGVLCLFVFSKKMGYTENYIFCLVKSKKEKKIQKRSASYKFDSF